MSSQKNRNSDTPISFNEAVDTLKKQFDDLDFEPAGAGQPLPGDREALMMADAVMDAVVDAGDVTWRDLMTYGTAKLYAEITDEQKTARNLVCLSAILSKWYDWMGAECYEAPGFELVEATTNGDEASVKASNKPN